MDPTAQNNNQKEDQNQVNAQSPPPQNPIQPGQYVVAQEEKSQDDQPFASPPPPPTEPVSVPQAPLADLGQNRDLVTPATAQDADLSKVINQQLAGSSAPSQSVPPPPSPPPASPPGAPPPNFQQPDPTPFNAVPAQNQMSQPPADEPKSKIKILIIIISVLTLIGLTLGLVWFFVLSKRGNEAAKTESTEVQFEEPSPIPNRETGGFGDLPQATGEAPVMPPSGQTQPQPDQGEFSSPSPVQLP